NPIQPIKLKDILINVTQSELKKSINENNVDYAFSLLGIITSSLNVPKMESNCPNNCSSHGICEDNICKCDEGYTKKDCSTTLDELNEKINFRKKILDFIFD